jgi:excisionase family DNA binding protein
VDAAQCSDAVQGHDAGPRRDAAQRHDAAKRIDIAAIASQVLAALDHLEFFVDEEMSRSTAWPEPAPRTLEEVVTRLERVEYHVSQLRQQMQALPAYMLRLERWSLDAEARLNQLDRADGPANVSARVVACPTAMTEAVLDAASAGTTSTQAPGSDAAVSTSKMRVGETADVSASLGGISVESGLGDPAQWRSVKEVAQALSLKESTVRRYIRQGRLPAARLPSGRGLRIRWDDVLARLGTSD